MKCLTPKVIWQTWKSKTRLPQKLMNYKKRWLTTHSDYKHFLLDDNDLRNVVQKHTPEYIKNYDSFTQNIERVDFARYALLYGEGGVYADLDTIPLKRIDYWVEKNLPVIGCEPKEHANKIYNRDRVLCNAFMISPPRKKIWKKLMDYIIVNYERNYRPVENTGPMAMTKLYETSPRLFKNVIITDPCVFYPLTSDFDKGEQKISSECKLGESFVAHIWENTWVDKGWWDSPLLWNARYWLTGLIILYLILWLYLFERKRNIV